MTNEISLGQLSFGLQSTKCTLFEFTSFGKENEVAIPFDKYQFQFTFTMDINATEKRFTINIVSNLGSNIGNKEMIANLNSKNDFLITNFEQIFVKSQQGLNIPDQALTIFLSIAISSLRGMYAVKLEGSLYENVVVPVIDPSQLIPQKAQTLA